MRARWCIVLLPALNAFGLLGAAFGPPQPRLGKGLRLPARPRARLAVAKAHGPPQHADGPVAQPNAEPGNDPVWSEMRLDAEAAAQREPLLVSFYHSSVLSHRTLESSLAFHLANRLESPVMIATQIQAVIEEALDEDETFRASLRRDLRAVLERDPACRSMTEALLYFKGFQALQAHRAAHALWNRGRQPLARFVASQVNTVFHIDIHPAARIGSGMLIDHGTGIVIGETASLGDGCSILHHVTLGGSGKRDTQRHPQVGNGVLIGAGASLLGNIRVGNEVQIGACSLVLEDIPERCVAVGVPAKILGKTKSSQPPAEFMRADVTDGLDFDI